MQLEVAKRKAWTASHALQEPMIVFFDPRGRDFFFYSLGTWNTRRDQSLKFQAQVTWTPMN
jgi:hypothetical protein